MSSPSSSSIKTQPSKTLIGKDISSSALATAAVDKATDILLHRVPNPTSYTEICDSIKSRRWRAEDVVKAVQKRLQNKEPKVQFFALKVMN